MKVGSLVRLCCGYGVDGDPRYKPGLVVELSGYAATVIWTHVPDPETWTSNILELVSESR
jgi:hypothetical protein